MRVRVDYTTRYTYDRPADAIVQALRLTPGDHDGQHRAGWRIDVDVDGALRPFSDCNGNLAHMFYAARAVDALTLHVSGEVDLDDTAGVVRGGREPLPVSLYCRQTSLTAPDDAVIALATEARRDTELATLHALLLLIPDRVAFVPGATDATTGAADALARGEGVCQDHAHLFVAAARVLGMPARYVSGHFIRGDAANAQPAAHAWAEAWLPGLGWVAFDPANRICATDRHLRVAVGLDYLEAAPVRGARRGGGTETMTVTVRAAASHRWQSQGQQSQGSGGQWQSQSQ